MREEDIQTLLNQLGLKLEDLTCHTCKDKHDCPYAYDPYNTNGDCLAIK